MVKRLGFWRRPLTYLLILTGINWVVLFPFTQSDGVMNGYTSLLIIFLGPHLVYRILPILLYKWKIYPCPAPLANRIKAEAYKRSITIRQVYIYKSKHPNAFAVGYGRQRYIGITEGFLKNYTEDEIMAVMAHEIGHHYYNDTLLQVLTLNLVVVVNLLINLILANALNLTSGPALFALCLLTTPFALACYLSIVRQRETRADQFALRVLSQPDDFATFLEKAIRYYESNGYIVPRQPSKLLHFFLDHPWIYDRISFFRSI